MIGDDLAPLWDPAIAVHNTLEEPNMKYTGKRILTGLSLIALLALATNVQAAPKSEDDLNKAGEDARRQIERALQPQ